MGRFGTSRVGSYRQRLAVASKVIRQAPSGQDLAIVEPERQHYPASMKEPSQQSDFVPHTAFEPWVSEPQYRRGVVDLLGILAYGALAAFDRLAEDARRAPTLADKVYVASLAALQIKHFDTVRDRLGELGVDVMAAMKPFHAPFDEFHAQTKPKDWLEGLVLAYLGNGFAADFYREVAAFVDPDTRGLVHQVLADEGHADFVIEEVRAATAADPRVAGRLALWGRRLVGEALSQAQRVAANREALTHLLTGTVDRPGMDLAAISRMFSRLVENHTRRMAKLGLQA
jgi:tRNA-(MS[2]IO[6]A)-hydroxylase (MiaE)-like